MAEFFNHTMDNLRKGPLGPAVKLVEAHPRLSGWLVLSVGMVILLVIEARSVGLLPGQWVALIVATVLVAGACIWIISWDDEEEDEEEAEAAQPKRKKKAKDTDETSSDA